MVARRKAGVRPQSSRTITTDYKALADLIGCHPRTIERHKDSLAAFLQRKGIDVGKVSGRYMMEDTNGQFSDTPEWEREPHVDAMAILREIADDPYGREVVAA